MPDLADPPDDAAQPDFLVVGLGASAGGVEALRAFFSAVPADAAIAFVVILHLSPEYDSQLPAILQTVTSLPVSQVTQRVGVEPNHVYVVPPNQYLTMLDSELLVSPNTLPEERRAAICLRSQVYIRSLVYRSSKLP